MQLTLATRVAREKLLFAINEVKLEKIYYVSDGRNAWHSTWIQRYGEGCMHTSLSSAKCYCEGQRVQGSMFKIQELPALVFSCGGDRIIITQINSKNIFSVIDWELLTKLTDILPLLTMTLEQQTQIFRPDSPIWKGQMPRNNLLILYGSGENDIDGLSPDDILMARKSYSVGADHYLNWSTNKSDINFEKVVYMVDALRNRLP